MSQARDSSVPQTEHSSPMSLQKKPPNCTCSFPLIVARNMCGHSELCPCYAEWYAIAFPQSRLEKPRVTLEELRERFNAANEQDTFEQNRKLREVVADIISYLEGSQNK